MSHFLYLKIYMGMYNFIKEIPVYIDLICFIIDKSWRVCDSVMQLVHKPGVSVVITPLMYHHQGRTILSNVVTLN